VRKLRSNPVAATQADECRVLPQTELEFSFAVVSITPSEGGFHGPSPERIELTGA
jgi:hypothetical protein